MKYNEKIYHELVSPEKQREWGWPAIANFTLGGAGAGFHCIALFTAFSGTTPHSGPSMFLNNFLGPIMVAMGFILLPIEAGRPSRSLHLVSQFRHSWLSREILFFLIIALTALLDYFYSSMLLRLLSIFSAVGFIISQGFIVYDSKGVTAWNSTFIPWLFLCSGIASGCSISVFVSQISMMPLSAEFIGVFMLSIAANAVIWIIYLLFGRKGNHGFHSATATLRRRSSLAIIIGCGHFLPICLILVFSSTKASSIGHSYSLFMMIAAGLVILGVFMQKAGIIRKASEKRSIGFNN